MTGLTLNYGDAWGLNSYSNPSSSVCKYIHNNIEDGIAAGMRQGLTRTESEDVVAVCLNGDDSLPKELQIIKRNDGFKAKVLESFKKDIDEESFINKSFNTSLFSEKDIEMCKKIGVTPEQMIDFIKSLY